MGRTDSTLRLDTDGARQGQETRMPFDAGGSTSLRLDRQVLGEARPWAVSHRGLEYPGEVIVAEAVNADWGRPLEGDLCFRIVFYIVPRRIPSGQIRDPRIAMVVPRRSADPARERLGRELLAIHEAKERYITGQDAATRAVRASMGEQEASLVGEIARREAIAYAQGRVYTEAGTAIGPSEIFVDSTAESWVEGLVQAVLARAYPSPPFDYASFPRTLTAGTVEAVFRGVLQGDAEAAETASTFGPALGLTRQSAPAVFDAVECRVVSIIEGELRSRGGEMSAQELLGLLGHDHGLTRALATLYLLAFVRQARGEVGLVPNHSVRLANGVPLLSDRISWDLVGEIEYTQSVGDELGVLRAQPSLAWNAALQYATLLVPGLRPAQDASEIAMQEGRLVEALEQMGRRIEDFREGIRALAGDLGEDAGGMLSDLDRLEVLSAATGFRGFYTVAVESFRGPSDLGQAVDWYGRLERVAALAPAITQRRRYLDEMTFGRDHRQLAVKRDAVVGRIGLDSLIGNPSLWGGVEESFNQLRREYAAAYASHHASYHDEAVELVSRLEGMRPQVDALARFNEVAEFGGPLGEDVPGRFRELMASLRTCTVTDDEIDSDGAPGCAGCLLPLNEDVPRRDAALVIRDTGRAMRVYNRRLSAKGVRRVLAHPTREQLDKFINLVQVGELSALSNVLDDEVLDFLRRFVRSG